MTTELAELAYETYRTSRSQHDGIHLKAWNETGDKNKKLWRSIASNLSRAIGDHFRALARVAITPERGAVLDAAAIIAEALATGERYIDNAPADAIDYARAMRDLTWNHHDRKRTGDTTVHGYVSHRYDGEWVEITCECGAKPRLHVQALEPYRRAVMP